VKDECIVDMIRGLADPNDPKHIARMEAAALRVERRLTEAKRQHEDRERDQRIDSLDLDVRDIWRTTGKVSARQTDNDGMISMLVERLEAAIKRIEALEKERHGSP
jgi:hypothetical protein